jgi:hypothetical protein
MAQQKRGSGWQWRLLGVLALLGVGVFLVYILNILTRGDRGRPHGIGPLHTLCTANVQYQYTHPKEGYARSLKDLGPEGSGYIDEAFASSAARGYQFQYSTKKDKNGLIEHYQVIARAASLSDAPEGNLYMDEACEIHQTKQDRAATPSDPIVK